MRPGAVCLCVLVVALSVPMPVAAQPETVTLRLVLRPGDAFFYTATALAEATAEIMGNRQSYTVTVDGREADRVLDLDAQGTALVEIVLDDIQIHGTGTPDASASDPTLLRVRPDGRVIERLYGDPLLEVAANDYPLPLPDRPVALNDSWSRETTIERAGVTGRATSVFTLVGVERVGETRVARIRSRTNGTVSNAKLNQLPPEFQTRVRGTVQGTGEFEWLVEQGRIRRAAFAVTIDILADIAVGEQTFQFKMVTRSTGSTIELLASDLPPTVVATEFLIRPGQNVGSHALSMTLQDLTSRLGSPTPRSDGAADGASTIEWPGVLVGYVDPADSATLIGLEVVDPQYRTDKGIGVRSSMGAAMLAYGLTPRSVDLPAAGAKVLVYDDQGIAFGIATTSAPADSGSGRAPVGAVAWVTIFSPGAAAKIFRGF